MTDVFAVADLLVSHAVGTYGDEVDLVAYYGSYARGTANPRSDLDIFYTPAEGKAPPLARAVLVDGVLFDFWAVPWERLEAWAVGRDGTWSTGAGLVHQAKVLYTRTDGTAQRLAALQQQTVDLLEPPARPRMIWTALGEFRSALALLGNLRLAAASGEVCDVRDAGWRLVEAVGECLALMNQALLVNQPGGLLRQLEALPVRPDGLAELITTVATSDDPAEVVVAGERLALATRSLLLQLQRALPPREHIPDRFSMNYPEVSASLDKIRSASEQGDTVSLSRAAWFAQADTSAMLAATRAGGAHVPFNLYNEFSPTYREVGLPELMRLAADPTQLAAAVETFDERIRRWLTEQRVDLHEFADIQEFSRALAHSARQAD